MNKRLSAVLLGVGVVLMASATAQQPGRAYRDIYFADSFSVVANKVLADEAFTDVFGKPMGAINSAPTPELFLSWSPRIHTQVGEYSYLVEFEFYDDKLYRVKVESDPQSATAFDTYVRAHHDTLVSVIERAKGRADMARELQFFDIDPGFISWSHKWPTNSEGVAYSIGIGEGQYDYYAGLWIEWTWLKEFKASAERQQGRDQQSKSAGDF